MLILNATKTVKSVMLDNGSLMQIKPGEPSDLIVASRNLIISAINLGDPTEIGIVLGGSYEMEIAGKITGSAPYLYTSLEEAKSKLIDPSIDYTAPLVAQNMVIKNEAELKELRDKNAELEIQIENLKRDLKLAEAEDYRTELENNIKKLEADLKEANAMKLNLSGQLKESQDQVNNLTKNLNDVRAELGTKSQELTSTSQMVDKLSKELNDLKNSEAPDPTTSKQYTELKEYALSLEKVSSEKDLKIETLTKSLSESADIIDNMKAEFNAACSKFGIYKDDNGEWAMDTESKGDSEE